MDSSTNAMEQDKMRNEPTAYAIFKVLKQENIGLSAKRIAELANIDTTSENLRIITDECWDYVDAGVCFATDLRKSPVNPALFFSAN